MKNLEMACMAGQHLRSIDPKKVRIVVLFKELGWFVFKTYPPFQILSNTSRLVSPSCDICSFVLDLEYLCVPILEIINLPLMLMWIKCANYILRKDYMCCFMKYSIQLHWRKRLLWSMAANIWKNLFTSSGS